MQSLHAASRDPVNLADPFGLCPAKTPQEALICGGSLFGAGPTVERAATIELALLTFFVPAEGIGSAALEIGQGFRAASAARAAGRALSEVAAAKGRQTILQQGSRILTASRHAATGSRESAFAHDFAGAGLDIGEVARAAGKDIGDLSKLAPGFEKGSVEFGGRAIDYTRQTLKTGETIVNFWMR